MQYLEEQIRCGRKWVWGSKINKHCEIQTQAVVESRHHLPHFKTQRSGRAVQGVVTSGATFARAKITGNAVTGWLKPVVEWRLLLPETALLSSLKVASDITTSCTTGSRQHDTNASQHLAPAPGPAPAADDSPDPQHQISSQQHV